MGKLTDKVALVTGGTSGIGAATARLFRDEGARVVATGSSPKTVEAAKAGLEGIDVLASNAGDIAATRELVAETVRRHGRIDVLFANAGIARFSPVVNVEEDLFDEVVATNLKGIYFLVKHALPVMPDGGAIIFTGSAVASTGGRSPATVYGATKGALRTFSRNLAFELLSRKIRVNTLTPGPIETAILDRNGYSPEAKRDYAAGISERVPMGRLGLPEEVAAAALFLAADATYTTGSELLVDGGMVDL